MYFPNGCPETLKLVRGSDSRVVTVVCNRDKVLLAVLYERAIEIWYYRPCVPLVCYQLAEDLYPLYGSFTGLEWRRDSSVFALSTVHDYLLFFSVETKTKEDLLYVENEGPNPALKRASSELFSKDEVPAITISLKCSVMVAGGVEGMVSLRDELMVATGNAQIQRINWDGGVNRDYCLDLRRVPFCVDKQVALAIPLTTAGVFVSAIDYSPLLCGFSIVLSDGRAAFLTASTLKFDPNQVQGIWAPNLDDATCTAMNHKYRIIAFGKRDSQGVVYSIEETSGALVVSHRLALSEKNYSGAPKPVKDLKWSPDGCALAMCWDGGGGGIALWSVFGSLLTCSFQWDYGTHYHPSRHVPFNCSSVEWGAEGYTLWLVNKEPVSGLKRTRSGTKNDYSCLERASSDSDSDAHQPLMPYELLQRQLKEEQHAGGGSGGQMGEMGDGGGSSGSLYSSLRGDSKFKYRVQFFHMVKSALTANPAMCYQERVFLQGEDRIYINANELVGSDPARQERGVGLSPAGANNPLADDTFSQNVGTATLPSNQIGNKQWVVISIPHNYTATNWPLRYAALDQRGHHLAVAGRFGVAHYSVSLRRWRLFGSETQEKDFIVTGGLLWWREFLVLGCYNLQRLQDEVRIYPRDAKLDHSYCCTTVVDAQVVVLSLHHDTLAVCTADNYLLIYSMVVAGSNSLTVELHAKQRVNLQPIVYHPACIVSVLLTSLRSDVSSTNRFSSSGSVGPASPVSPVTSSFSYWRSESSSKDSASVGQSVESQQTSLASRSIQGVLINICGRLILLQLDLEPSVANDPQRSRIQQAYPTVLASNVENMWQCNRSGYPVGGSSGGVDRRRNGLWESLWLHCGALGMRIWLPLFPQHGEKSFMAKRIMLPVPVSIYPLAVLYEAAVVLGVETDTIQLPHKTDCDVRLPFCVLERTSEVYLQHILRQLLKRNLGLPAWEIAQSCCSLPYFPHALELLLHHVLEEEATSKDPLPDALLPSVVDFIKEFPNYLQTIVGCSRKSEIALWHHLFTAAGNPRDLFLECLRRGHLDTATNYLVILQNVEVTSVSRQYATMLLASALESSRWDLSRELVRYLRAIDPNDSEGPRASVGSMPKYGLSTTTPPLSPNEDDLSLVLGTMQVPRGRSMSTAGLSRGPLSPDPYNTSNQSNSSHHHQQQHREVTRYPSGEAKNNTQQQRKSSSPGHNHHGDGGEDQSRFIEGLLTEHARKLLSTGKIRDLGFFAANLDFHLATWFKKEKDRAAKVEDFVASVEQLHADFNWPYPILSHPISHYLPPMKRASFTESSKSSRSPTSSSVDTEVDLKTFPLTLDIDTSFPGGCGSSMNPTNLPMTLIGATKPGDSGYVSHSPAEPLPPLGAINRYSSDGCSSSAVEVPLKPGAVRENESVMSMRESDDDYSSSLWGGSDVDYSRRVGGEDGGEAKGNSWEAMPNLSILEQLSQEMSCKGPQQAEVQLRYMLQMFQEGGCLEWSLLVAVLLKDAMAVLRTLNAARAPSVSQETLVRLQRGLKDLGMWTDTQCPGYKPLMLALQNQVSMLLHMTTSNRRSSSESVPPTGPVGQDSLPPEFVVDSRKKSAGKTKAVRIPGMAVAGAGFSHHRMDSTCSESSTVTGGDDGAVKVNTTGDENNLSRFEEEMALRKELERQGWCSVS